jgi:hypothetical protein
MMLQQSMHRIVAARLWSDRGEMILMKKSSVCMHDLYLAAELRSSDRCQH